MGRVWNPMFPFLEESSALTSIFDSNESNASEEIRWISHMSP